MAQIDISETYDLGRELNALVSRIEAAKAVLIAQIAQPAPRNAATIEVQCGIISTEVRKFVARYPVVVATQTELQRRAEALGKTLGATRVQMPQHWYDMNTSVNRLRQALNLWVGVQELVRAQIAPKRRPLYPRTPRIRHEPGAVSRDAGDRVAAQLHRLLGPEIQSDAARDHGCFGDIPLPMSLFMQHALAARRICLAQRRGGPLRFLDIGCGNGLKVLAARQMFDRTDGLEYDPALAEAARALLTRSETDGSRIHQGDAAGFEAYADYDVLYLFRPMRDAAAMEVLERRVAERARPGALIIAPYRGFATRHAAIGCTTIAGAVYGAGMTAREARSLRRQAELTGTAVRAPELALATLWDDLLAASFANGFAREVSDWLDEV